MRRRSANVSRPAMRTWCRIAGPVVSQPRRSPSAPAAVPVLFRARRRPWNHPQHSPRDGGGGGAEMTDLITLPTKTREMHNHHFDSTIWNDLEFRDDDIVISTYAKSGTTWMQQIVAQLLFGPDPDLSVAEMSPWLDLRVPPKEVKLPQVAAQAHRRFLKT